MDLKQRREAILQTEQNMANAASRRRGAHSALFALTGSSYGDGRPPVGAEAEYEAAIGQLRDSETDYGQAQAERARLRST